MNQPEIDLVQLQKTAAVNRQVINRLKERVSLLENALGLVCEDPHLGWLYRNRSERMDATVPMFPKSRANFHLARYEFAAERVAGKTVADIACGTGYGVRVLSQHSAGITRPAVKIADICLEEWEEVIRINLTGTFLITQATIPAMIRSEGGSMVLISSRAAKTGFAALGVNTGATKAHYCASKAGVISLTKSLATELARHNIRVNGIAPGPIEGTMIPSEKWSDIASRVPLGRLGRPEEIAETARFLCSQQAGFITGHILDVNGGTLMD